MYLSPPVYASYQGTNAAVGHYLVRAASVPEPSTISLLVLGAAMLATRARTR